MVSGDAAATAVAVATKVGICDRLAPSGALHRGGARLDFAVAAGVLPEDKLALVDQAQRAGHAVAMTGDAVNDAPALKRAEVGIAVSAATDVAQDAASIVLTDAGLGGIVTAIETGRRVYQQMPTYTLNEIAKTFQVSLLLGVGLLVSGPFVTTPRLVRLLLFSNDFVTMSIATDRVGFSSRPDRWRVAAIASAALAVAVAWLAASFATFYVGRDVFHLGFASTQTLVFVILVFTGQATVYLVRERRHLWASRPSTWMLVHGARPPRRGAACQLRASHGACRFRVRRRVLYGRGRDDAAPRSFQGTHARPASCFEPSPSPLRPARPSPSTASLRAGPCSVRTRHRIAGRLRPVLGNPVGLRHAKEPAPSRRAVPTGDRAVECADRLTAGVFALAHSSGCRPTPADLRHNVAHLRGAAGLVRVAAARAWISPSPSPSPSPPPSPTGRGPPGWTREPPTTRARRNRGARDRPPRCRRGRSPGQRSGGGVGEVGRGNRAPNPRPGRRSCAQPGRRASTRPARPPGPRRCVQRSRMATGSRFATCGGDLDAPCRARRRAPRARRAALGAHFSGNSARRRRRTRRARARGAGLSRAARSNKSSPRRPRVVQAGGVSTTARPLPPRSSPSPRLANAALTGDSRSRRNPGAPRRRRSRPRSPAQRGCPAPSWHRRVRCARRRGLVACCVTSNDSHETHLRVAGHRTQLVVGRPVDIVRARVCPCWNGEGLTRHAIAHCRFACALFSLRWRPVLGLVTPPVPIPWRHPPANLVIGRP